MQEIIRDLSEKVKTQDLAKSEWLILFIDMGLIKVSQTSGLGSSETTYTINTELYPNAVQLLTSLLNAPTITEPSMGSDSGFQ